MLEYVNKTNSEKKYFPLFMMTRCIMVSVIEAKCTNVNDPGQKKTVFGAQKYQISRIFSEKMPKIADFYVARNCAHRKHVDRTNL